MASNKALAKALEIRKAQLDEQIARAHQRVLDEEARIAARKAEREQEGES